MFIITNENGYTKLIANGNLKHADYIHNLLPNIKKVAANNDFRIMVVLNDMQKAELKTILSDIKTYTQNKNNFDRIAIVTSKKWIQLSVGFFRHLISTKVKTFSNHNNAEKWLTRGLYNE